MNIIRSSQRCKSMVTYWLVLVAGIIYLFDWQATAFAQNRPGVDRWINWNNQPSTTRPPTATDQRSLSFGSNSMGSLPWTLGIRGINTRTGVLVRGIDANSAALSAGIREGDSIVTAAGIQVGLVGSRLIDLDQEINRSATSAGQITLVTHSQQTGRLQTVDVQLRRTQGTLSGTIVQLNRLNIPSDAFINVQVVNVTRPHFGVRNGAVSLRPTGSSVLPFNIAFDPDYIYSQDRYEVSANVTHRGNVLYQSEKTYPVLTQGNSSQVEIRLISSDTNVTESTSSFSNSQQIDRYIDSVYQRFLGRRPYYIEHATLMMDPQLENRLRNLPLDLMATQEFYDLVGNNDTAWITRIFEEMAGRRPLATELENWRRRFSDLRFSRSALLAQLDSQIRR